MFNALYLCPERYLTGWRKHLDLYAIWFGYPAFKREHTKLSKELVIALEEIGITQFNEKTFFLYSLNDLNEEIERANQAKRKIEWRNKLNLSEQS